MKPVTVQGKVPTRADGRFTEVEASHIMNRLQALEVFTRNISTASAPRWEDLRFPASGFNPAGSTAPPTVSTSNGLLVFSGVADNIIGGVAQMPHSWLEGSAVRPHLHLRYPAPSAGAVSQWSFEYDIANPGEDFSGSLVTLSTVSVAAPSTSRRHVKVPFGEIQMAGYRVSATIMWQITRLGASDADATSIDLMEFDIHYQIDSNGSRTELEK